MLWVQTLLISYMIFWKVKHFLGHKIALILSIEIYVCGLFNSLWDSISKLNSVSFVKTNSGISVKNNGSKKAQVLRLLFVPCASDLWLRIHNVLQTTIFLLHIMLSIVFFLNTAKWFGDYKVLWFLSRIILTSFVFNKDENI